MKLILIPCYSVNVDNLKIIYFEPTLSHYVTDLYLGFIIL